MSARKPPAYPVLSPYQQEQAIAMVDSIRERLLAEDPDIANDPELLRDMIDGETDAIDILRSFLRASIDADKMAEAAKNRASEIAQRAARFAKRKDAFRAAAFALMDVAGIRSVPEADFLARVQDGKSRIADSLDVNKLPDEYVEIEIVRKPKMGKILEDLLAGETIPGADLANGVPFLVVQSK